MVEMIVSDHEVMQNEGLLAVTILSTVKLDQVEKILLDAKIGEKIVRLIKDRKPKKEVFANVLTLIRQLSSSSKYFISNYNQIDNALKMTFPFRQFETTFTSRKCKLSDIRFCQIQRNRIRIHQGNRTSHQIIRIRLTRDQRLIIIFQLSCTIF